MREIINITDEAQQLHKIPFFDFEIRLSISFHAVIAAWFIDIEYKDKSVNSIKLSLGTLHLRSNNLPFDFVVVDLLNNGFDPFKIDDFLSERFKLILLEPDDMEERRGYAVEI